MKLYLQFQSSLRRVSQKTYLNHLRFIIASLICLLCINPIISFSQTLKWQIPTGAAAVKVKTDGAGNVYIAYTGGDDIVTVKYNAAGVQQWAVSYNVYYYDGNSNGGPYFNTFDKATDLQIDASGNVYVTGTSYYPHNTNHTNMVMIKYSTSGARLWVTSTALVENGWLDNPHSYLDSKGNLYIAVSYLNEFEGYNFALYKLTSDGVGIWNHKRYPTAGTFVTANAIHVDIQGNVYITGSIDENNGDYLTLKFDNAGILQWEKHYNGPNNEKEVAAKVKTDAAGNVYVTGTSISGNNDILTIKYNAAGEQQWVIAHNTIFDSDDSGDTHTQDKGTDLQVDAAGNVYATGTSFFRQNFHRTEAVTIKYTTAGTKVWAITTAKSLSSAQMDDPHTSFDGEGNLYVAVSYHSEYEDIINRLEIDRLTPAGDNVWAHTFTASTPATPEGEVVTSNAIHVDGPGNIYVTGRYTLKYAAPPILPAAFKINFQDKHTKTPVGWLKDYGLPFAEKIIADSTYSFGWKQTSDGKPVDLSLGGPFPGNGRWRPTPADPLLATLMHMQGDDVKNFRGTPVEAYWELSVENGAYQVTVSVGDGLKYSGTDLESHSINVEGVPAITHFVPQGGNGSSTRFKQATVNVTVTDGLLTIDAEEGTNTKINYASIQPLQAASLDGNSSVARRKAISYELLTSQQQVRAYPNPFTDKFYLSGVPQGKMHITLVDGLGRVIFQSIQQMQGAAVEVDLSEADLKTGVYFLQWHDENGAKKVLRVLKR